MKNIAVTQLTQADRDQVDTLLTQLETLLKDKLTALTEEERVRYGSINEQNKLLVNKTRDLRQTDAAKTTPDIDWTEFEADYQARIFLETRGERLKSLAFQMQSTKILHDYDNFQDSLTNYSYAQYRKGAGEPGYTELVAELKQFFPRTKKTPPDNPDVTP